MQHRAAIAATATNPATRNTHPTTKQTRLPNPFKACCVLQNAGRPHAWFWFARPGPDISTILPPTQVPFCTVLINDVALHTACWFDHTEGSPGTSHTTDTPTSTNPANTTSPTVIYATREPHILFHMWRLFLSRSRAATDTSWALERSTGGCMAASSMSSRASSRHLRSPFSREPLRRVVSCARRSFNWLIPEW